MNKMSQLLKFISEITACCSTRHSNSPLTPWWPRPPSPRSWSWPRWLTRSWTPSPSSSTSSRPGWEREQYIPRWGHGVSQLCSVMEIFSKIWSLTGEIRTLQTCIYIFAKTKLDLNYISINCHHILPTIKTPSSEAFSEYPCAYQLWQNCLI